MDKGKKRKHDTVLESSTEGTKDNTNKLSCNVCKMKFDNENSMKQHILGQKHKRLWGAEEERRRVENKCGIFVRGYPPYMTKDSILKYFSQYGDIVWNHFGPAYVLIDFNEPSAVQRIMRKERYLAGRRIMVQYRKLRREVYFDKPRVEESTDYMEKLKSIPTFDQQLEMLFQNVQPQMQELFPIYEKVCADLHGILSGSFSECEVHRFGSTITGLNFKNSDIDVYISGIRPDEDDDKPYLVRLKIILLNSRRFANIIVIGRAKIPILKCVHIETGIDCDINLRNKLGVCNSQLINYYLNIDPKIKNSMIFLKHWAKVHGLSGQSHLISNYSLCMMLIFFLQQDPYKCPSVELLQQNPSSFRFHDGWNGGFEKIPVDTTSLRNTSVLKLLENFFSFYAEYEYGINVICPFLGTSIRKRQFFNSESLPDCFKLYKAQGRSLRIDAPICIQDPFEHCRNTTPISSTAILEKFVRFCRLGKKLCRDGENSLLYDLLTTTPSDYSLQSIINPEFCQFSIAMRPNLRYIQEKISDTSNRIEEIRKAWFKSVVNFTTIVLKDFLKFDLTEVHDITKVKNTKRVGQSDVYDNGETRVSYQCIGKMNLWEGRKVAVKENKLGKDESNQGIIKRETAITNHLCQLYEHIPLPLNIIDFEITLECIMVPTEVIVKIKKNSAFKNTFDPFVIFFTSNLRNWFDIYEKELDLCKE